MPAIYKKADFALALLLIAMSAASLLASSASPAGDRAEIRVDGAPFGLLYLSQPSRVDIKNPNGETVAVAVCEGGSIHVENATCPDKICQHSAISRAGEVIICLPNRVVIEISGARSDAQAY